MDDDLARTLRAWRERLRPVEVGLLAHGTARAARPALRLSTEKRTCWTASAGSRRPATAGCVATSRPDVQRMLDRLDDVPIMVLGAAWELMTGNAPAFGLLGDPSARRGHDRNIIWRHFTGVPSRFVRTEAENAALELEIVADRHMARGRYPDDPFLRSLVDERMH